MVKTKNSQKSVTYVLCYRDPNYVRTQNLITALKQSDQINLRVIRNKHRSVLRYPEVIIKAVVSRFKNPSDTYFIGFRGHEIFWFIYPFIASKKIIFDEFICTYDWFTKENSIIKTNSFTGILLLKLMRAIVTRADIVLSDTKLHAGRIQQVYGLPSGKSQFIYVGTDERVFYPRKKSKDTRKFNVFFYGNMLPLHGINTILSAVQIIKKEKLDTIHFTLVGGKGNKTMEQKIKTFIDTHELQSIITHIPWVQYDQLPEYINAAQLTLGGPFGNTPQAQKVITGKTYQFLAMSAPVVIGKIDEDVGLQNMQNCLLVNQGSSEDLADAVIWAYENQSELAHIGERGRELFEEKFSIKQNSKKLESIV